jgi:hypothetical protein
MNRLIVPLLAFSTLTVAVRTAATVDTARAGAEITRKVYISADVKGVPVTDLKAADITVKEGGKAYPVVSLQPATAPMQIAILVDDQGMGGYQLAVAQFLQKCVGHGQFAISLLNPQALQVVDFTADVDALKGALQRLGQRGRVQPDIDQLPRAIVEAAKDLQQHKAERPVIVVLTVAGGIPQNFDPNYALNTLRLTGTALNVVVGTSADIGPVLDDGPKQSGGRIEEAGTKDAAVAAAVKIGDRLLHQYLLTYTLPDGVKMSDKIAVTTSRKGIDLTAPSRIADK